jgi:hypothetical protein
VQRAVPYLPGQDRAETRPFLPEAYGDIAVVLYLFGDADPRTVASELAFSGVRVASSARGERSVASSFRDTGRGPDAHHGAGGAQRRSGSAGATGAR